MRQDGGLAIEAARVEFKRDKSGAPVFLIDTDARYLELFVRGEGMSPGWMVALQTSAHSW